MKDNISKIVNSFKIEELHQRLEFTVDAEKPWAETSVEWGIVSKESAAKIDKMHVWN